MLDVYSVSVVTGLVCVVSGILFVSGTLVRRDDSASKLWALAFLSSMMTTVAYLVWASGAGGFMAVGIGNALFALTYGLFWLGSRRFNESSLRWPTVLILVISLVVGIAVAVPVPSGGSWAGATIQYTLIALITGLGSVETFRGRMGRARISRAFGLVLALQALFYVSRVFVVLLWGADSVIFETYFAGVSASLLIVIVNIVCVVVTSVLRAARVPVRGFSALTDNGGVSDGILSGASFVTGLRDIAARAEWRREKLAVISVRVENVIQISSSFGSDTGSDLAIVWRNSVRRYAPSISLVGEDGATAFLVCTAAPTGAEARRQAARIYRGLMDAFIESAPAGMPLVGIGVALSDTFGYDGRSLIRHSRDAAKRASTSIEASVLFAGALPADTDSE